MGPNEVLDKSGYPETEIPMFHCVKQTGNEHVSICDTLGEYVLGVSQDTIDEDDQARRRLVTFRVEGITRAVANAAISLGAPVTVAADGRVQTAGTGHFVLGRCTTAADQENDHIDLHITREGVLA